MVQHRITAKVYWNQTEKAGLISRILSALKLKGQADHTNFAYSRVWGLNQPLGDYVPFKENSLNTLILSQLKFGTLVRLNDTFHRQRTVSSQYLSDERLLLM